MGHSTTLLPIWRVSWAKLKALFRSRQRARRNGDIVQHPQVPARVLADHLLGGLRQVGQLHHGHGLDEDAARAQRIAERGVLGGARGGEAPQRLERVQADELVVAEADLRAPEEELEGGPQRRAEPGPPRGEGGEEPHALHLVDEPGDGHADEDGRLLDGADAAADVEPGVIGQGERDALVGERPLPRQLARGDPAIGVGIRHRVGVAHAHEDRGGVMGVAEDLFAETPGATPS